MATITESVRWRSASAYDSNAGPHAVDLTDDIKTPCAANLEFWHKTDKGLLGEGEIGNTDDPNVELCLRLITAAQYDIEEDQFFAKTIYGRSDDDDSRPIPTQQ